jgi:hypothetical protein
MNQRFEGKYHLHIQDQKSAKEGPSVQTCLMFDPEYGYGTFIRNVSSHTDYMKLYPIRWHYFNFSYMLSKQYQIS